MHIAIQCTDNETLLIGVEAGETLYEAAKRQGLGWPVDCLDGVCGTCKCQIISGQVDHGHYTEDALTEAEIQAGQALGCQATAKSDLVLSLRLSAKQLRRNQPSPKLTGRVERVAQVAENTMQLTLSCADAPDFLPGQYAKLKVPGKDAWRAYSFSSPAGSNVLSFLIRLLPAGEMSDYLRTAKTGDVIEFSAPHGTFFLRPGAERAVLIAGGTGLGPMLSMLRSVADGDDARRPLRLLYGVNTQSELACLELLDELKHKLADFSWSIAIVNEDSVHHRGFVTDLLDDPAMDIAATTFYLCGPPPMIDSGRAKLNALGVSDARIIYEKFLPAN